jgi:DNA-binding response OmpR family regulator
MVRQRQDTKLIGYGIASLYTISFFAYFYTYQISLASPHLSPDYEALTLTVISLMIVLSSVGMAHLKEWGRRLVILGHVLLAVCYLKPYYNVEGLMALSYLMMSFVVVLYLNQDKVRARFKGTLKDNWRSILIIDDDETFLKMVRPTIVAQGYAVLTATTGEEGLQMARKHKPDLIILDVILPKLKGREVCKKLKMDPSTSFIPIAFVTSKHSQDDVQAEMEIGAVTHLNKPLSPRILVSTIRDILEGKEHATNEWRSILLIDDDESILLTSRHILLSHGFSVLTATAGEEGIRLAKQYKPDLILLDVILPGLKGRDVCKQLKLDPLTQNIPVVFLTAKHSTDDIHAEMEAGAVAHLPKPITPEILISTVKNILNLKA